MVFVFARTFFLYRMCLQLNKGGKVNYIKFCANLKMYRQKAGKTQQQLAESAGCSVSHVGHIETGIATPSMEMALKLADALNITLDQLTIDSYTDPERVYIIEMERKISIYPRQIREKLWQYLLSYLDHFGEFGNLQILELKNKNKMQQK